MEEGIELTVTQGDDTPGSELGDLSKFTSEHRRLRLIGTFLGFVDDCRTVIDTCTYVPSHKTDEVDLLISGVGANGRRRTFRAPESEINRSKAHGGKGTRYEHPAQPTLVLTAE